MPLRWQPKKWFFLKREISAGRKPFGNRHGANLVVVSPGVLLTLDADFANMLRYPSADTPGIVRLRLHPATEQAIDEMLKAAIPRVSALSVRGKLVVVDERKIRIRG